MRISALNIVRRYHNGCPQFLGTDGLWWNHDEFFMAELFTKRQAAKQSDAHGGTIMSYDTAFILYGLPQEATA